MKDRASSRGRCPDAIAQPPFHNLAPFNLYDNFAPYGHVPERHVRDGETLGRGMTRQGFAFAAHVAFGLAFAWPFVARAQDQEPQLGIDRIATIESGAYTAGDTTAFSLVGAGGGYLFWLDGSPEVFVLTVGHGSLGGRILQYDSGETALKVAGWGGMTLYTDAAPQGLPAMRTGDALAPPSVSLPDLQHAAGDAAEHLSTVRRIKVRFTADWNALSGNSVLRACAFDAMGNAARGIERFAAGSAARDAFAERVSTVAIRPGSRPGLGLTGQTLVVTFNSGQGFSGRASSRAVAHALGNLLARPHS
jgi:hypothetical protein